MITEVEIDVATQYAIDVVDGKIISGELARLACERHLDDLNGAAYDRGFFYDTKEAAYVARFISCLKLWEGKWAGQEFTLEPWQQFIIGSLFGWRRFDDGLRRFRTGYLEVARKNAKSTLLAGIGLYMLDGDMESGAQVYSAATKKDQAKIIFNCAKRLADSSPHLTERIQSHLNNLSVLETYSKFEPLASDSKKADGFSVSCGLIDELHEHPDGGMMDVLETGTSSREQPLILYITTAGKDQLSVCYEQHEYTRQILQGRIQDDTYFGIIYSLDKGDDWRDETVYQKANPNLGVSVFVDDLIRKRDKAKHVLRQQTTFRRKHANEWVGADDRWIDRELWDACHGPFNPDLLKGRTCYAGLDLASKLDLTALVLVFPPDRRDEPWKVIPFFWLPEENLDEKAKNDRAPYEQWVEQGFIFTTPGNIVDYKAIIRKVRSLGRIYNIKEIGFDPWNATATALELQDHDFEMVEVRQGIKTLGEPFKELEALVTARQIAHNGHPVLSWNADNVRPRPPDDNGNTCPSKRLSRQKIDGITALCTAFSRAINQDEKESIYKKRGLIILKPR